MRAIKQANDQLNKWWNHVQQISIQENVVHTWSYRQLWEQAI